MPSASIRQPDLSLLLDKVSQGRPLSKKPFANDALSNQLAPGTLAVDIQAKSELGTASLKLLFNLNSWDPSKGLYRHALSAPAILTDGNNEIGRINQLELHYDLDPVVALNFMAQAGNSPTNFIVTSMLVPFTPLNNPLAFATAGMTVSDSDANLNGANTVGNYNGNNRKSYRAFYNSIGEEAGTGTAFASLVNIITVAPFAGTNALFENTGDFTQIPGAVYDISSRFGFTVSTHDQASGTSTFIVVAVPEPASVCLLLGASLLIIRPRRRSATR